MLDSAEQIRLECVSMLLQQVLLLPQHSTAQHTSKAELEISLGHWDVQFCGICAIPEGKPVVFRG